ncbi:hypothetical protein Pcinc_022547 [Petrolisthes cinctipes]|uniref:Uncharacterized protein n=1 Tax=Petrolisthes cinctipes TaxID=88211 RepID=A0AAE1FF99_PETCI|nr:hypothetical protein Pcinc_022547 [Petrolisthes cinctipes]
MPVTSTMPSQPGLPAVLAPSGLLTMPTSAVLGASPAPPPATHRRRRAHSMGGRHTTRQAPVVPAPPSTAPVTRAGRQCKDQTSHRIYRVTTPAVRDASWSRTPFMPYILPVTSTPGLNVLYSSDSPSLLPAFCHKKTVGIYGGKDKHVIDDGTGMVRYCTDEQLGACHCQRYHKASWPADVDGLIVRLPSIKHY